MNLHPLDLTFLAVYVVSIIGIALWVSREKAGHDKNANDYFLAGNSLPWWAIGASLIAANISAEQIIGMSGSGYLIGLGIASYEWMAALTLIIVGKFFLPIFLKRKIYTMPQFLEQRYDHRVRYVMAIFWLGVYVFVNLTAVLWLGALAINTIAGVDMVLGMLLLAGFSVAYSLYGGLKAVALTDIIQVVVLVVGGLFLTYTVLVMVGDGGGAVQGFIRLMDELPEKFDMILAPTHDYYKDLPGISVLIGGLWIMNLSYWGFNQYIIQRALAAKSLQEAQKGIVFAAFLKMLMPLIVVVPGIAAVLIVPDLQQADTAYPSLLNIMPVGIKGIIFAALVAAIVSSIASMSNSVSTIFTMDLYADKWPNKSQQHYVLVGRIASISALIVAMLAAQPLLGKFDQAFAYIQEFTGFFTPGIVTLFILGMFWKRTTANAGLAAAIGSAVFSVALKMAWPELPFLDRVGLVFLLCVLVAVVVSFFGEKPSPDKVVETADINFRTTSAFNVSAVAITILLVAFYTAWW